MKRKPVKYLKRSTTLYIAPVQQRALQRLAARLDVSMGHLIREGINLVLEKHQQPKEPDR
jgi:hypothetical protein